MSKDSISTRYTVDEYLTEREWSKDTVILIEGESDYRLFSILLDEISLSSGPGVPTKAIAIETPDHVQSPDGSKLGNREKVELICARAAALGGYAKIVGFVDREFRWFRIGSDIIDEHIRPDDSGNLFWTRGHSIENYLFEFEVLRESLRNHWIGPGSDFRAALSLFETNMVSILRSACAVSLAAAEANLIEPVRSSIRHEQISFIDGQFAFDTSTWMQNMKRHQSLDDSRVSVLVEKYNCYVGIAARCDPTIVRWLGHGHISFEFVWASYAACLVSLANSADVIGRDLSVSSTSKQARFTSAASRWAKLACQNGDQSAAPFACIRAAVRQLALHKSPP